MPNLVSITYPSLSDIGKNSDGGTSNFRTSRHSLIKENCHNSRTSDDIDMKYGPVTKLDKRKKTTPKNLTLTSCQKIVTSFSFFGFLANLEQSGGRIPDTESTKVMFSIIGIFSFAKAETRTKKPLTQLCSHTIALSKGTFLDKKH